MSGKPRDDAEEGGDSALTTMGSLMEERVRYEAWLQALNARRAETPKHVFTRVHADYTARLEAVVSRLTGQVEALRGELTTLATRIATLDEQQHRARDEHAEAELRAHVGELSEEAWQDFVVQSDATMARLARQHAQATEALRRTREFLSDAEKPATPPVSAAPVAPAPAAFEPKPKAAPSAAAAAAAVPAPAATAEVKPKPTASVPTQGTPRLRPLPGREPPALPAASAPAGTGKAGNFDELAFLSSVVEEPAESGSARDAASAPLASAPHPSTAVPAPAASQPPRPSAPPPAPRPSVATRNPFAQRAQDKIVNNDGATGPKIESNKVGGRSPLAGNVSGNNPIVLRDKTNEAAKTLKCGECGAVNYPTEWYCERCGAELASL
jgi:hypothetical protein